MDLVYFILTAYGLTQILVYGSIFNSIRPKEGKLGELFRCAMCMGFWVGAFLFGINAFTELFANLLVLGCLSSGTSYVLNMVFGDEGIKIDGGKK